jgi:hypothetical protein
LATKIVVLRSAPAVRKYTSPEYIVGMWVNVPTDTDRIHGVAKTLEGPRRIVALPTGKIERNSSGLSAPVWEFDFEEDSSAASVECESGGNVDVVELYADYIMTNEELLTDLDELVGKDLICWCAPQACHGDVLMALANPT